MRRAAMIVNPRAGRAQRLNARLMDVRRTFSEHSWDVEVFQTTSAPGCATELAKCAAETCELVVACGGDGTVHEVLQGVKDSAAILGVLPLGTANALARNLGLPLEPVAALSKLLGFGTREIPLGVAKTNLGQRWFLVMAGAGPDGRLAHEMAAVTKSRWGRSAYYTEAARLFLSRRFHAFRVEYRKTGSERWEAADAVAMMASRVPDLGGLFAGLTVGSRLDHPHLQVQLLASPASLSLPAWVAMGRYGLGSWNPWLTTVEAEELRCSPLPDGADTFVQVDGEAVGVLPLSLRVQEKALRLLMPE